MAEFNETKNKWIMNKNKVRFGFEIMHIINKSLSKLISEKIHNFS